MFSRQHIIKNSNLSYSKKPLQVQKSLCNKSISFLNSGAGASFFASLTFEAAVVMPIFICIICAFFWFFVIFGVQFKVQGALWEVSGELSEYAFLYEQAKNLTGEESRYISLKDSGLERWLVGGVTHAYAKNRIITHIGNDSILWNIIRDGKQGIYLKSFLKLPDADGMIDLSVVYEIVNPFLPENIGKTTYIQRSRVRAWTGWDYRDDEAAAVTVYVTEHGTVYHLKRDCTYLEPKIETAFTLTGIVWRNGMLYRSCSVCSPMGMIIKGKIYITETGVCYHSRLSCSTLNRIIYEITLEEAAAEYPPCSKCGREEED